MAEGAGTPSALDYRLDRQPESSGEESSSHPMPPSPKLGFRRDDPYEAKIRPPSIPPSYFSRPKRDDPYEAKNCSPSTTPLSFSRTKRDDGEREYHKRSSPSSPPICDRRHSSSHRIRPPRHFKQERTDNGGYDRRWDCRREDWLDSRNSGELDVMQRQGFMSFKQFVEELEDDISPTEAQCRYEEYRATQKKAYFEAHKDEEWLKNKYHPTILMDAIERSQLKAKISAEEFMLDLQGGKLDIGPSFIAPSAFKSGNNSEPENEVDWSGKRTRYSRGSSIDNSLLSSAPKSHPVSSESQRIQADIQQAQALVQKLDMEKGIQHNLSMGSIEDVCIAKGIEGSELLDTLITYLWRVHCLDYYGMSETCEAKGLRHVRAKDDWEIKLDNFWLARLQGEDPMEALAMKDNVDAATMEVLASLIRKIPDKKNTWRYSCGVKGCTKSFFTSKFVHKHLKLKHPDLAMEMISKVRQDLYFQNYMNDPNAPGGTPVMQQSAPKATTRRRRLPFDDYLRDEQDNRDGLERNDRDDDRQ